MDNQGKKIKRIWTNGYSGPSTQAQYLTPGAYVVGSELNIAAGLVPESLAGYLVDIEKARVVEWEAVAPLPDTTPPDDEDETASGDTEEKSAPPSKKARKS